MTGLLETPQQEELLKPSRIPLSIILPTYNESQNITEVIDTIAEAIPEKTKAEIIVVDDNSPDGTGGIVAEYANKLGEALRRRLHLEVINRPSKLGLSSAILAGVKSACGDVIIVMDSDMSHPPQTIPKMLEEISHSKCDIVVASRYVKGGEVSGWPFKRKMISKGATKIAQYSLGISIKDPMSGFFAFRHQVIDGIKFDAIGYKMLLEILVKAKGAKVMEIPYTFTNRRFGASKLDVATMRDYAKAVWRLYRYGKAAPEERRRSVHFLSKAGRFYSVGASGLFVNYVASFVLTTLFPTIWYLHATVAGIVLSITSNFILNKLWTFEDRDLSLKRTIVQYGMFAGFSVFGALVQLGMVYYLVENQDQSYPLALIAAVATASLSNFLLNKKWTFKEKIWG
jgi:dolichol-phosphate mannosyltransferase